MTDTNGGKLQAILKGRATDASALGVVLALVLVPIYRDAELAATQSNAARQEAQNAKLAAESANAGMKRIEHIVESHLLEQHPETRVQLEELRGHLRRLEDRVTRPFKAE